MRITDRIGPQRAVLANLESRRFWRITATLLTGIVALNLGLLAWFAVRMLLPGGALGPSMAEPVERFDDVIQPEDGLIPDTGLRQAKGIVNILILGIDQRPDQTDEPTRSDVMMVARVDFDNQAVHLLSFPRDIWIALPEVDKFGVAEGRINQAYYWGEYYGVEGGGAELAKEAVELNFGIPIDYYVLFTFEGFKEIVDAIGGIEINVPESIYDATFPTDNYGTMELEIEAGWQHMDGAQALRYARTRHQDADTKRILRQQLVLLAIRDKALQIDAISRWPELYASVRDAYETDIPLPTMLSFALAARDFPDENVQTFAVSSKFLIPWVTPGGAHVWIPRRAKIGELITEFMTIQPTPTSELP